MFVYVTSVEHRHGTNVYTATTEALALKQLADYCREWWDETNLSHTAPEDDSLCVEQYFEAVTAESWSVTDADLVGAEGVTL